MGFQNDDQAIRVRKRQRSEECGVEKREDDDGEARAEHHQEQYERGEPPSSQQATGTVANVLPEEFHLPPFLEVTAWLLSQVSLTLDYPLVGGELFETHGASGVKLVGRDPDFGAEAEDPPIRESCGRVPEHRGRIDFP